MFQLLKLLTNDKPVCKETFGKQIVMIYAAIKGFCDRIRIPKFRHFPYSFLILFTLITVCYFFCLYLGDIDFFKNFLSKVALSLGGRGLSLLMIKMGCGGGLGFAIVLAFRGLLTSEFSPYLENRMLPEGNEGNVNQGEGNEAGPSNAGLVPSPKNPSPQEGGSSAPASSSSWKEDSFEIRVLLEPFSETDTSEGTSVNPPIPRVAGEEGGPSHQTTITHNASWESSLRTRIKLLENENSPFLLDKERGEYFSSIKAALDQAPSQHEYNRLLEFENRDLQIRELKHLCSALFRQTLSQHPDLLPKCIERDAESAVFSFLEYQREEFEAEFAPDGDGNGINTHCIDKLEMDLFQEMADDLHKNGGSSYYFLKLLQEYFPD